MPALIAFDGQVFAVGADPTDPGEYDLLGNWNPGALMAAKGQVVRCRKGQVVRIVLQADGVYDPPRAVHLYLEDDPDDPMERPCEVGVDNTVSVALSPQTTDLLSVRTYRWEVWADGDDLPLGTGILVVSDTVRDDSSQNG